MVEVLVAVSLLTIVAGLVSTSTFQILTTQRTMNDDLIVERDLRHAGSRFAGDALVATTTTLIDLAPATSTVTLTWTDVDSVYHRTKYSTSTDNTLTRTYSTSTDNFVSSNNDAGSLEMAGDVVDVSFSLSGKMLTFYLEVEGAEEKTNSRTLITYLRYVK